MIKKIWAWFDNEALSTTDTDESKIDWLRVVPFFGMHLACFGVFWVGVSWFAVGFAALSYFVRMFAITAFYHRYFSHKAFKTGRKTQFAFAMIGASSTQRGPLWWAAHHRHHHQHADQPQDVHTPRNGFWQSHMGWFLTRENFRTDLTRINDFARFPELRWLDRFDLLVPIAFATTIFLLGWALEVWAPQLETGAWQLLIWGYFIATVALIHATLCINSLAHKFGSRRYAVKDDSRNNLPLALLTLGEGWHNNHHHYPLCARQGFYWWEVDVSYYLIKLMSKLGLVWEIKPLPLSVRDARENSAGAARRNTATASNTATGL